MDIMKITFPGGKGGDGVYQRIINLMPPHEVYIETHLGGGGIMRKKRPAQRNIGIEIDPKVIELWSEFKDLEIEIHQKDAVEFIKNYQFTGNEFVYCDPPYLRETRDRRRKLYVYEYTRDQHIELLKTIRKIPAMVMISGYESELYKTLLHDWNKTYSRLFGRRDRISSAQFAQLKMRNGLTPLTPEALLKWLAAHPDGNSAGG